MSKHEFLCLTSGIAFWLSRKNPVLRRAQPVPYVRSNLTKGETHDQNRTLQVRITAHDSRSLRWNPSHYRVEHICSKPRAAVDGHWCCPDAARGGSRAHHRNGFEHSDGRRSGTYPVDTYNRANINKSGEFTTEQFLQ